MLKKISKKVGSVSISKIEPNNGLAINYKTFKIEKFAFDNTFTIELDPQQKNNTKIEILPIQTSQNQLSVVSELNFLHMLPEAKKEKELLKYPIEEIKKLNRCNNCILPETFPFIIYDNEGICNYCRFYKKSKTLRNH